jgi:hypothetical protein
VIREIEKATPLQVRFEKAIYWPIQGLALHDVKIYEKTGRLLFSADKLAVNVRIIPFFQDNKIIVSRLRLDGPRYELSLEPKAKDPEPPPPVTQISGQIVVPTIPKDKKITVETLQSGPDSFLPENVYLEEIQIANGTITIRKKSDQPPVETLSDIHIRMGFHRPPILTFDGSVRLGERPYASVSLRGTWDLQKANYEFFFDTKSDYIPPWLLEYQKKHFVVLERGAFSLNTHLKSIEEERAVFRAKSSLRNARILANKAQYTGTMGLEAVGLFDFERKKLSRYRGRLEFKEVDVIGLSKTIPRLDKISGQVGFETDLLEFKHIKGRFGKVVFMADGRIDSFKELRLKTQIRTDSKIDEVLSLIPPEHKRSLKGFELQGQCQSLTLVSGSLRKPQGLVTEHKLALQNASILNREKKIDISGLSAHIDVAPSGVHIQNGKFLFAKVPYALNAFLPQSPKTPGKIALSTRDYKASASFNLEGAHARIIDGRLDVKGCAAKIRGRVANYLSRPFLDLQGEIEADLAPALTPYIPKTPALKDLGLRGMVRGPFILKGYPDKPLDMEFGVDAKGSPVFVKNKVRLDAVDLQVRYKNRILNIPYFHTRFYGGTLGLSVFMDLFRPNPFFDGKLYGNNIDIGLLGKDLDPPQKELKGSAVFQLAMSGHMKSPESLRGNGVVDIRDGELFKSDLFKDMGNLMIVKVVGMDNVVFEGMNATFFIRDKRIWTENLNVTSSGVYLTLRGSVSFDQTLDMIMNIRYSPDILRGAEDTGGIVPYVIRQAENFISEYRVSGTLKNPKYDKIAFPVAQEFARKVSGIIQNISR